jgi:hypothetical protein
MAPTIKTPLPSELKPETAGKGQRALETSRFSSADEWHSLPGS